MLVAAMLSSGAVLRFLLLLPLLAAALRTPGAALASPQSLESDQMLAQCVKLVEELSSEGVNVSQQVELLNTAIKYLELNQPEAARPLVEEAFAQLDELREKLPSMKLEENLKRGAAILALAATPALFYYFFPRLYALVWLHNRRSYVVRHSRRGRK